MIEFVLQCDGCYQIRETVPYDTVKILGHIVDAEPTYYKAKLVTSGIGDGLFSDVQLLAILEKLGELNAPYHAQRARDNEAPF